MTWFSIANWLKRAKREATGFPRTIRRDKRVQRLRIRPRLEELECRNLLSTLTVLKNADSGAGSLRDTIAAAQSGDTVIFDPSLDGQTITLTSGELAFKQSLDIEGPGADQLTVSGNNVSRVFELTGSGADVIIAGLTIADGLAVQGGGIENLASTLTLVNDVVSNNQAVGLPGGPGEGGGIFNGAAATLQVRGSVFAGDVVHGGAADANGNAGPARGGALFNGGVATVRGSSFVDNQVHGGDGGPGGVGGNGQGGAIWNEASLAVCGSVFADNEAIGGIHGRLGEDDFLGNGAGAGIYSTAILTVTGSVFTDNRAQGGAGYAGVAGGIGNGAAILAGAADDQAPASATICGCTFAANVSLGGPGGDGAAGGGANGAVLVDHGTFLLRDSKFLDNWAIGGPGGTAGAGGAARGGALRNALRDGSDVVTVSDCTFRDNQAVGGMGGNGGVGGLAGGGAISNAQTVANEFTGTMILRDCVLQGNEAIGGAGVVGGAAHGGGISTEGGPTLTVGGITTTVIDSLIADNLAQGADGSAGNGGNGLGGGLFVDAHAVLTLTGSTVTGNTADGGAGAAGFSNGKGQGGGLYVANGGSACSDIATLIFGNSASTGDDDVFGVLGSC